MSVVAGDLSACSLAEALSARATRSEESKIHGPHEYYMQHIVPVRGVRVKYLPSSTMMYSCTCAWLQNPEAPLVCAPAGLRRPYAHTSDTRSYYEVQSEQFPINNNRYRLPSQRPGASTLSITWSLCSGGFGPATYRSIEAPDVSES